MKRLVDGLSKPRWEQRAHVILVLAVTTAIPLPAQTFTTLFTFDGTDGGYPVAALVQGTDGNLYGTTELGIKAGTEKRKRFGGGTVFKITPDGTLTTLYSFCRQAGCVDGDEPADGLVQGIDGDFYGTTYLGGANGFGGIFKIAPGGTLTTIYGFCSQSGCTDGSLPLAGLTRAANGDFYGTTENGGANGNHGTVFKITPGGTLTTLYSFCSQTACADGEGPVAGLVQANNGDFYGTTPSGGTHSGGTLFKITPSGTLTTLYSFCAQGDCTDGTSPEAGLIQATNGDLYGTTHGGGVNDGGNTSAGGTIFKITPTGTLTTLYSFCSPSVCTNGDNPFAPLIQATDGNFYGTTYYGGTNGAGTIFKITPSGTLTTLYSFCSLSGCSDGEFPLAGLVQATNGDLYGTASHGGAGDKCQSGACGTVFRLSVGLGPFVETRPTSGKAGAVVEILGTNLIGATSVSFNGTTATFTVNAIGSAITTILPAGATTGTVHVATPNGTLSSNVPFRILP